MDINLMRQVIDDVALPELERAIFANWERSNKELQEMFDLSSGQLHYRRKKIERKLYRAYIAKHPCRYWESIWGDGRRYQCDACHHISSKHSYECPQCHAPTVGLREVPDQEGALCRFIDCDNIIKLTSVLYELDVGYLRVLAHIYRDGWTPEQVDEYYGTLSGVSAQLHKSAINYLKEALRD